VSEKKVANICDSDSKEATDGSCDVGLREEVVDSDDSVPDFARFGRA